MPCATLRKAIPSSRSRAAPPRPSGRLTARALEPLAEERNRAFRDYVEAFYNGGDEAKGIELARRVDEKAGLIRDFKIAYVREHPLRRSASPSCRNFATASRGWIGRRWSR